jgi:hypothetical protein
MLRAESLEIESRAKIGKNNETFQIMFRAFKFELCFSQIKFLNISCLCAFNNIKFVLFSFVFRSRTENMLTGIFLWNMLK